MWGKPILLAVLLALIAAPAGAADLPQGNGLAAAYPGDEGIRQHPDVVFADGFESYDVTWEGPWPPTWDGVLPPRTQDRRHVHRGQYALELKVRPIKGGPATYTVLDSGSFKHEVPSRDRNAGAWTWYDAGTFRGSTGYEEMFARWYVMFAPGFIPGPLDRAAGALVGARNHWRVVEFDGRAKPDGRNLYLAAALPVRDSTHSPAPGQLVLSTLGTDSAPDARGRYLGASYLPQAPFAPRPGQWYCLEIMLKPNAPDRSDGEQALWVDGKLVGHWTGLRLRTDDNLKVNGFWLQLSVADGAPPASMWCDDVVVAKSYIGPMAR